LPFGKFAFALLQPLLSFLTPFVRFFVSHIPRLIGQELKGGDAGEVFELARELGKHVSAKLALNANRSAATTFSTTSRSRRLVPIRSSFGTA
jgi:hypothetical protein